MKRNLDTPLVDFDGKAFGDGATLKTVVFTVLSTPMEGDDKMSLDQKMKQYALLQSVHKGGVVDLTAEEITLIKSRGVKMLGIIALGRMCELLETEYTPPEVKS